MNENSTIVRLLIAEQRAADDRRRRARDAGNDRDRLEQADEERLAVRDLGEIDLGARTCFLKRSNTISAMPPMSSDAEHDR